MEPSSLRFDHNPYGKPALIPSPGHEPLNFNLAHSHDLVLYAITRNRQIGIDLERLRTDFPCEEISEQFFSPRENAALLAVPQSERHEAFFRCWTRKEAYVKARGEGLSLPLQAFDVSLAPDEPAKLLSIRGNPEAARDWSLYGLAPAPGYVAALAVNSRDWRLSCWQWSEDRGIWTTSP
jgi:4'-phosphopantetheinyl transferase